MEAIPFPRVIDSSIRKEFRLCEKRGFYSYFRGLETVGGNIHLHFGKCFAKGAEVVRQAFYGDKLPLIDSLAIGAKTIVKEWKDFTPPDNSNKNLSSCLVALYDYFSQYPPLDDPIKPVMLDSGPALEFTFALPIPGTTHPETGDPILYGGRVDMLASYRNAVFVVDDKTSTQLGKSWAIQWKLASQLTGYVWAARQFGYPVMGTIVRGVGILKTSITHQMCIEDRPRWMVERWLEQLQRDIARMVEAWKTETWHMDLDHSCGTYGGCPFLTLCTSPDPESWVDIHYERREWNPLLKVT